MKFRKTGLITLLLTLIVMLAISTFFYYDDVSAMRSIHRRDYLTDRRERFSGNGIRVGNRYAISVIKSELPHQVTFNMISDRAILIKIDTTVKPSGVIMLASQPSSPRILKPVWTCEDLREPVFFWTDQFWTPTGGCNSTGCPKIRFIATRGSLIVYLLNKR